MESTERDFHHPYNPYHIQYDLMNAVYECIEKRKIGIFESPTAFQEQELQNYEEPEQGQEEPDWVLSYAKEQRKLAVIEKRSNYEVRLRHIRATELRQKQRYENKEPRAKRTKMQGDAIISEASEDARFELDEYESEDEGQKEKTSSMTALDQSLSSASMDLMDKLGLIFKPPSEEDGQPNDECKIIYSSRTHSQLTQFVQEMRRVDLPAVSWMVENDVSHVDKPVVKHIPLGSRKNLCINPKVSRLGSAPAINERCLELQQPNTAQDHKCPFVPNKENETLVNDFKDHTLAKIRDIEELGSLGEKIGICPYYASRATIKPSEVVTLPYPLLLQKSAREALGISLKGHVVIIDEAHNLMDAISNIHSIQVTHSQLKRSRSQLGAYLQKFRNRLKGKNRVYVAQVVRLIDSISGCLDTVATAKAPEGTFKIGDLMAGRGVDQINLYKLMRYLLKSKLARKIEGYVKHAEDESSKAKPNIEIRPQESAMPVLTHVQFFFQTLTNPAAEGRFFYETDENNELSLKYMLLDPSHHFQEIVEDARAVLLAGGTMSPMDDYIRHLFPYLNPDRLLTFSCGHIIPPESLIALPISQGPDSIPFDFTYSKRNSVAMISALGNCLLELSTTIPDGLVVFFPSYSYLEQVVRHWQSPDPKAPKTIWDRLQEKKPIFQESKTGPGTDAILADYSLATSTGHGKGALLLSVIGGKLSEGINFSDSLGRGVVVVGLPYPNIQSAQWKAKLEYVEQKVTTRTGKAEDGKAAAREFYENACMRAVNQCVGRAIRHKEDFATVLLVDRRYSSERIMGKLPGWIREGIVKDENFSGVIGRLERFFDGKKRG